MEEKLISLKTAKLAKEKGYNWKQSGCYSHSPEFILSPHGHIQNHNKYKESGVYSAPTQSLLQKWIREVHKIDIYTDCLGSNRYYYTIYVNNIEDDHYVQESEFSFEDALEDGLFETLKLIKNV